MEPVVFEEKPPNLLAVVSLIFSLLSVMAFVLILVNFIDSYLISIPIITGLISSIIGTRSIRQIKAKKMPGMIFAIAGILLGCVPVAFACGSLILVIMTH